MSYGKIAVLISCHNRREKTLACLNALTASLIPGSVSIQVFLVDDGSTDGTGEAVRRRYADVRVIEGDGKLYWNGGMRQAFAAAMEQGFDYYLWLNDDTFLYPHALATLLKTAEAIEKEKGEAAIVVGTMQAEPNGPPTYGGVVRISRWRPVKFQLVTPSSEPVPCETMNGNCVLIPRGAAKVVGNLDGVFIHSGGDTDYGLRAGKAGFPLAVMPGYAGICTKNPVKGTYADPALPLRDRLSKMRSPKGLPAGPWYIFTRRHAGPFWWLFWIWPYVRIIGCAWGFRKT